MRRNVRIFGGWGDSQAFSGLPRNDLLHHTHSNASQRKEPGMPLGELVFNRSCLNYVITSNDDCFVPPGK